MPVEPAPGLQPVLSDGVVLLRAPVQAWSRPDGSIGGAAIDGIYLGDLRQLRSRELVVEGTAVEPISLARPSASSAVFGGVLRGLDDPDPDPKVRLLTTRTVTGAGVQEVLRLESHLTRTLSTTVTVRLEPEFGHLGDIKNGVLPPARGDVVVAGDTVVAGLGSARFTLRAPDAQVAVEEGRIVLSWPIDLGPRSAVERSWSVELEDDALVVAAPSGPAPWAVPPAPGVHPDAARWLAVALDELDALRLTLTGATDVDFLAAGAPWFLTLFGRDALWAARLLLPLGTGMAGSTLRALAVLQASDRDDATSREPGKIPHELRASMPVGTGSGLPPLYYGSVDATPLWACLLVDAWRAGLPEAEVRALLLTLRGVLDWLVEAGDSDGDGFIDYIDRTGRGLANQGWKDSGDSIQWRDGRLAVGPIALCEVQGYAHEAAVGSADLLDALGEPGGAALREWAAALRARFAESYWVDTPEGRYPAIALDADKNRVDTLTSNIGHLLGTGILDGPEEAMVADLLVSPALSSGFGVRTMSTGAAGYWPLSYHGGSVWIHDTAIIAAGMARAGLPDHARRVAEGMLAAAVGFGYRVPELHSGDAATLSPYPAACHPQAWSAAAAVTAWRLLRA
ncbi:MAG: glycogen debranching N-terminal domain-containing protein [Propionicimonas sp.]|uniref:amylo-alpha-1,6-glucosidase n=1 Tax=Propionicimonas sp. TaxID=1955623 RepID=UPI003D0B4E8E